MKRPRIAILGAGIRGSSLAALLSVTERFDLLLIERNRPGSGATATNHGRLHLGVWNYRTNTDTSIQRNLLSQDLIKRLPGVIEPSFWGYYCISAESQIAPFLAFCEQHNISYRVKTPSTGLSAWIQAERYHYIVEVPEFSFNSARVAAAMAHVATQRGNCTFLAGRVEAVSSADCQNSKTFSVLLHNQEEILADIVVNSLGAWSNDIVSDLGLPRLDLSWKRWRLLALHTLNLGLPPLDRVITVEQADNKPIGALPHGMWAVFGCDVPADEICSPIDLPPRNILRPLEVDHPIDRQLFHTHAEHFPVLMQLNTEQRHRYLLSFSGVYPEIRTSFTAHLLPDQRSSYVPAALYCNPHLPDYYQFFGGSATTALLDAAEACSELLARYLGQNVTAGQLVDRLAYHFPITSPSLGMIWEYRGHY